MANNNNTTLHFRPKYIAFYKTQWSLFLDSPMWDCYALKKLIIFDSARRRGEEMAKRAKKEIEKKICESFFLAIAFFWFFGTWVKLPAAAPNDALLLWIALKFVSFLARAIKRNARDFLFCAMANCMGKKCFFLLVGEINKTFTTAQHSHTEPREWDGRELGFSRGRKVTLHCNNVRLHCWRLELLVFLKLETSTDWCDFSLHFMSSIQCVWAQHCNNIAKNEQFKGWRTFDETARHKLNRSIKVCHRSDAPISDLHWHQMWELTANPFGLPTMHFTRFFVCCVRTTSDASAKSGLNRSTFFIAVENGLLSADLCCSQSNLR